jgi:hypothetical protein
MGFTKRDPEQCDAIHHHLADRSLRGQAAIFEHPCLIRPFVGQVWVSGMGRMRELTL